MFDAAPPPVNLALVHALLRPLGVLSVVAVAGGVFGKIRFHPDWPRLQDDQDLVRRVTSTDIVELVNHAQKVSFTVLDNLARVMSSCSLSPLLPWGVLHWNDSSGAPPRIAVESCASTW